MRARIWLTLFWLLVIGTSSAALFWTWKHPPRLSLTPVAPSTSAAHTSAAPAFAPVPLAHYAEIVERPIFIDARRPQQDETEATPPTPPIPVSAQSPLPPLRLVGVVLLENRAAALLRPEDPEPAATPTTRPSLNRTKAPPRKKSPQAKVLRLPQGGTLDGWLLETVRPEKVIFRRNNEVQELALLRPQTPPQPPPPGESATPNPKPTPQPKAARAPATSNTASAASAATSSAPPLVAAPETASLPVIPIIPSVGDTVAAPETAPAANAVIVAPPATNAVVPESASGL